MPRQERVAPHPEFGPCLAVRARRAFYITLAALLGPLGGLMLVAWIVNMFTRRGSATAGAVLGVIGAVIVLITWMLIQEARKTYCFYERGALVTRGRRVVVSIAYAEVTQFAFAVRRNYYEGVYTGTTMDVRLNADAKRSLVYSGSYREKAKGFLFKRTFEANEELEAVKLLIAERMAETLEATVLDGGAVDWCKLAAISADGLSPLRGKRRGVLVPYVEIDRQAMPTGRLELFRRGEKKAFLAMPVAAVNFWPGFVVFSNLHRIHVEEPV